VCLCCVSLLCVKDGVCAKVCVDKDGV
jgi:hypothetical protein